ncbi:MAG TPA: hypothetical protein VLA89_15875 [Gemmatimonadales bacterium]|nr:hypothetical protein [Gemmatimonadales bacterium]
MPLPTFGSQNPYYQTGNLYGGDKDYSTSPIVSGPTGYLEQNPEAAYARHIAGFGGGSDPYSRFVQQQYDRLYNQGYQAAAATNPNLTFQRYLTGFGDPFFRNLWANLTQTQRGENPAMFAGRPRWITNG